MSKLAQHLGVIGPQKRVVFDEPISITYDHSPSFVKGYDALMVTVGANFAVDVIISMEPKYTKTNAVEQAKRQILEVVYGDVKHKLLAIANKCGQKHPLDTRQDIYEVIDYMYKDI